MDYIPNTLNKFIINRDIAKKLENYDSSNIVNMIFYGKNNSGKKTLVDCLLNHIFKDDLNKKKRLSQAEIRIGNNKVEIDYVSTIYHLEINLYEYGLYDKDILTDFVFDLISNKSLNNFPYKILVINHVDKISENSQLILRRIIDKCSSTCRVMLICEDLSKINKSLLSRFSLTRVPLPRNSSIKEYIQYVSKTNHKFTVTQQNRMLNTCDNDLYLLNHIIMATIANPKFNYNKIEDVNRDIQKIFRLIDTPNLSSILEIRSICYNLLLLNFSMKELFNRISSHYTNIVANKCTFAIACADINEYMGSVEHDIICIEYLILKVKKELLSNK